MSGIYIHIPFCEKICSYCDFYKSASLNSVDKTVLNIVKEIELRKEYLGKSKIKTIYFGGGTPSILNINQLKLILSTIYNNFKLTSSPEITLEANPDDLNYKYLHDLKSIGINRLSVGIQSFNDKDLKILNRRHTAKEAVEAIKLAKKTGFKDISIDLIYGLDFSSDELFIENIEKAISLDIQHISAYHLTIEKKTKFFKLYEKGELSEIDENRSNEQFKILINKLAKAGFEHYEISNFAKKNFISTHNSNYWKQVPYLGIGPSSHSYNGDSRQWNVANIRKYNKALESNLLFFEKETLSQTDKFNDYIITSLRTIWGADSNYIKESFSEEYYSFFIEKIEKFLKNKELIKSKNFIKISRDSIFLTDFICTELIYI